MALTQAQVRAFYDKSTYLSWNPDIAQYASANNWNDDQLFNHYYTQGLQQNRIATPIYIQRDYAANNADVKNYGVSNNWTAADYLNHYITYGINEARVASHLFYAPDYLANNADLKAVVAANPSFNVFNHYLVSGRNEAMRTGTYINSGTAVDYAAETNNGTPSSGSTSPNNIILNNLNDKYVGTVQDDTFLSDLDANGTQTISSSTILDGTVWGNNSLNIRALGAGTIAPQLKNIQKVSIRSTANNTFDALKSPDLANVNVTGNSFNNTVKNIKFQGTELGVINASGTNTFSYSATTNLNSRKSAYLTLDNASGTVTITNSAGTASPSKLTINSINDASEISLTDNGYANLVAAGNAALDLSSVAFASVAALDSTAMTAGINASIATNEVVSIKTGSGNDVITRTNMKATDVIDLGAGKNTLNANSAGVVAASALTGANKLANITNLNVTDSLSGNVNLAKFSGLSTFSLSNGAGSAYVITNVPANSTIKMGGATVGATGLGNNLELDATNAASNFGLELTTANNYYVGTNAVNLTVQADAAAVLQLTDQHNVLQSLTVKGAGSADFTLGGANLPTNLQTVDAHTLTGGFTISAANTTANMSVTGSLAGNNTITDGKGNDIIIGGKATDVFITNIGKDTFTGNGGTNSYRIGAAAAGTYNDANTPNNKVVITDFNAGTSSTANDCLNFSVGGFTQTQKLLGGSGSALTNASAVSVATVTTAAVTALGTNNVVFYENGSYANAAALQTVLNAAGTKLTFSSAASAGALLVAYKNTTDGCIDVALVKVASSATDTTAATVQDIVSLGGVTDWTNLDSSDFGFIS